MWHTKCNKMFDLKSFIFRSSDDNAYSRAHMTSHIENYRWKVFDLFNNSLIDSL